MHFVYVHAGLYGAWIVANLGWIPGIRAWDPSFVVLAMIASAGRGASDGASAPGPEQPLKIAAETRRKRTRIGCCLGSGEPPQSSVPTAVRRGLRAAAHHPMSRPFAPQPMRRTARP
jgi:hypothetical protein